MATHLHGHHLLKSRSRRVCATPNCGGRPEPKDRYCIKCQLEGKAPERRAAG